MIEHILRYVLPAAAALLPAKMDTVEAKAMLLATGLQESRFSLRRQQGHGPARGFWQFEVAGVEGVLTHDKTNGYIASVLLALRYDHNAPAPIIQAALEHNDVLACCFARCLLWTAPTSLPGAEDAPIGWRLYESCWRPGAPHPETWAALYDEAWARVTFQRALIPEEGKKA